MSAQLIELVIFAAIAFFVISKLISVLGSTSDDDPARGKSFFGESGSMKDVTSTTKEGASILKPNFFKKKKYDLKGMIVPENEDDIIEGLSDVAQKMPAFNPSNFIKGAIVAFKMLIEAGFEKDQDVFEELVDKRYLEHFSNISSNYGKYTAKENDLDGKISEIYTFGNNVFVKMIFAGKNITSKVQEFHEEWTFTKSVLSTGPAWQLSNIDRPQ